MGKNRKILMWCIASIVLGTSIVGIIVKYLAIDEPVFINSYFQYNVYLHSNGYYDEECEDIDLDEHEPLVYNLNERLTINYISNKEDSRSVSDITFVNAPEVVAYIENGGYDWFEDFSYSGKENYGRYNLHTLDLVLQSSYETIPKVIDLSKAQIHFNNGDLMNVDLGEIILYCKNGEEINNILGDGRRYQKGDYENEEFSLYKSIIAKEIYIPNINNLYDEFIMTINDYDYNKVDGLAFSAGKDIVLKYGSINWERCIEVLDKYNIQPMLYCKDVDGNEYIEGIGNIYYDNLNYSFSSIYKYLKQRGKL